MAYETRAAKKLIPISTCVLSWYDKNARILPWRIGPRDRKASKTPDPYAVWLSEIMLQQTTVAAVAPRYVTFLDRWPDVKAMADAPLDDILGEWAGLGYYARARNLHKCAVAVAAQGGVFPNTEEELRALPGIGDYTAAAIAAIAFGQPAAVVDGNIERIVSRLYAIETALPAAKPQIKERTQEIWPQKRSGDFAQGLMDLGAGICKPKAPMCLLCPLTDHCQAMRLGRQEDFPKKAPKKAKPERQGVVYGLVNGKGEVLFERRPEKGLLGGMLGLPGGAWSEEKLEKSPPVKAKWTRLGAVEHVFTHFRLTLEVRIGKAPKGFRRASDQQWIAPDKARLPTVMKKAVGLIEQKIGDGK